MKFNLKELKKIREQIADEISMFSDSLELERKFEAINIQINRIENRLESECRKINEEGK